MLVPAGSSAPAPLVQPLGHPVEWVAAIPELAVAIVAGADAKTQAFRSKGATIRTGSSGGNSVTLPG